MNKSPEKRQLGESAEDAEIKASRRLITMLFAGLFAALIGGGYLVVKTVGHNGKNQTDNKPVPADVSSDHNSIDSGKTNDAGNNPMAIIAILTSVLAGSECKAILEEGQKPEKDFCEKEDKRCFEPRDIFSFLENIPQEVADKLKEFDPEKFKMLLNVLMYEDPTMISWFGKSDHASYYGRGCFEPNGAFRAGVDVKPEHYLIGIHTYVNDLEQGLLIVHEVYGHAYDDINSDLEELNQITDDDERSLYIDKVKAHMRSEFVSYYVMFKYISWLESKPDFEVSIDYYDLQDYLSEREKLKALYDLFKEATASNDWTCFKKAILSNYMSPWALPDLEATNCDYGCLFEISESLLTPDVPTYRLDNKQFDSPKTKAWLERKRIERTFYM